MVSHASQQRRNIIQYPFLKCTIEKLKNPTELIKARWIRPEDIGIYEGVGVTFFKLAGREKSTDWIIRCAESYSRREYKGNLLDIIAIAALPTDKFGLEAGETLAFPAVWLDNEKLQGFLSFFEKNGSKCDWQCDKCSYCSEVAKNTISYRKTEVEAYLRELERLTSVFLMDFPKGGREAGNYARVLLHKGFETKIP